MFKLWMRWCRNPILRKKRKDGKGDDFSKRFFEFIDMKYVHPQLKLELMEDHGLSNWQDYFQKWPVDPDDKYRGPQYTRGAMAWDIPEPYHHSHWVGERAAVNIERAAQDGDQVTVSFVGKVDGEEFEGGSAHNVPIELGAGRMIEGFEQGLLGATAGEERTIYVDFPDDYQAEHLAGKPATFEISVNEVAEPVLPELDDDFARAFGVEEGGMEKLRSDIRENMERELSQKLNAKNKEKVMDLLLENNDFTVPRAMIDSEAQRLKEEMKQQMQGQGSVDLPLDIFIKLNYTLNYDNQPAIGATERDYVFQTTLGWEL